MHKILILILNERLGLLVTSMEYRIDPPHCSICHNTWWPRQFDWRNRKPLEHDHCPICRNSRKGGYVRKGAAPKLGDPDVVICECPTCLNKQGRPKKFLARRWWIERQYKHCDYKNGQGDYLPIIIKDVLPEDILLLDEDIAVNK